MTEEKKSTDTLLWYAIYTKYKCEKQVSRDLNAKSVHNFLPLTERIKKYTRKIKKYQIPLINCYVFVKIDKTEKAKVLQTENVIKFIQPGKNWVHIPEEEINILKRITGEEVEITDRTISPEIGEEVEIIKGSLAGMRGNLIKRENKNMVVIDLSNVGYQLNITVDIDSVKKI